MFDNQLRWLYGNPVEKDENEILRTKLRERERYEKK